MPKLRVPATDMQNRTIIANIKYGMEMTSVSLEELALAMRTSTVTVYDRFKHPDHFRLSELRAVASKLHMTIPEILQSIQKETA